MCGSQESMDFHPLQESTHYDSGFDATSATIVHFWEIVHALTDAQKKALLRFVTGSDRTPVGGWAKLHFIINKNGGDSDRIPTSHTCYNVLLLNDYATKEKLKEKLFIALENCDCGFHLN